MVGGVIGTEYGVAGVGLRNEYAQLTQKSIATRHLETLALGKLTNRRGGDDHQSQG